MCVYVWVYLHMHGGIYTHKYIPVFCRGTTEDKVEKANKVAVKFHFYDLDNTGE